MVTTIRDVALRARVSTSTVSRVLNHNAAISDKTARRVKEAMRELNYVPNESARSFATGDAKTIAIAIDVANINAYSNRFFNNTVFGIETNAHNNGYNLLITHASPKNDDIVSVEKLVRSKKIDGIILPESLAWPKLIHNLRQEQFPCVILGKSISRANEANWVDINNIQAGILAVHHLIEAGYERIAYLSDNSEANFNRERLEGYKQELKLSHLTLSDELIATSINMHMCKQEIASFIEAHRNIDAIVCSSDLLALNAIRVAHSMGLSVPQKLGILSFDNSTITEVAEPSITSLEIDTYELGIQATEILLRQISDPTASLRQLLLAPRIIARESSKRN